MNKFTMKVAGALNKIANLFAPPTVDDVLSDLQSTLAGLERAAEAQQAIATSNHEVADIYRGLAYKAENEQRRALRLATKFEDLLN